MTEQELRQEFKNHSDCYSDAFEVIQAMTEDAAIALAKAYADARESKEIAELKAESKYWNERWEAGNKLQDAAFNSEIENYHEVKRLNAEIKRLRDGIAELRDWDYPNQTHIEKCNALLSPAPVTEGKSHGEAITSKPKPRDPITALEAMSRLKSENEARKLESETRILHEMFHQVGNSTWMAKGCAEITLEANGTWTLERIGKKGKKAIIINKPLWQCLQKAKAIIEKLGSHKNEDQE